MSQEPKGPKKDKAYLKVSLTIIAIYAVWMLVIFLEWVVAQ